MKAFVKLAGVALLALGLTSAAEAAARIGVLRCHIQGGEGYVIGSSHGARCFFKGDDGRHERYVGRMSKLGVDLGVTHENVLVWAVFAPSAPTRTRLPASILAPRLVPRSASAAVRTCLLAATPARFRCSR